MPSPSDFIHPAGHLTVAMFPGETLTDNVAVWLTEAQAKTGVEDAQRAWVYYRAYDALATRFNLEAMEVDVKDQVRRRRMLEQITLWQKKADEQLARYGTCAGTSQAFRASSNDPTFNTDTLSGFVGL